MSRRQKTRISLTNFERWGTSPPNRKTTRSQTTWSTQQARFSSAIKQAKCCFSKQADNQPTQRCNKMKPFPWILRSNQMNRNIFIMKTLEVKACLMELPQAICSLLLSSCPTNNRKKTMTKTQTTTTETKKTIKKTKSYNWTPKVPSTPSTKTKKLDHVSEEESSS